MATMTNEEKRAHMREYMRDYRKKHTLKVASDIDQLKARVDELDQLKAKVESLEKSVQGQAKPVTMDLVSKIVSQMNETLRKFEVRLQKLESLAKE